jgi:hypothetical protein
MALGRQAGDLFGERVELGRRDAALLGVDQCDVEAGLAQQGQRPEDLEPVLLEVTEQAEYLLPLPLQVCLVDLAVLRF